MTTPILLLAAGSASRMRGGDKLLEDVHGAPCLQVMAKRALATGQPVLVTMPSLNHPRAACLTGLELSVIEVPNADLGMSHSLQRGVAALPNNAKAVMILPADMPDITTDDMNEMLDAFVVTNATAMRATTQDGATGHPTLVGMNLFEQFQKLTGDKGANAILSALGDSLMLHALKGDRARIDLDTPEDWSAWRARTQ
ncbi:MAG: nucleotidyltransferase family protein [Ascidiaceihabitans sp.]|jgi:molybdenum cofactor cytidylyltransferase|tara:strand:- start:191 stop:784 length:594 start_codon:yes stop_codon:yes gene_type:complete